MANKDGDDSFDSIDELLLSDPEDLPEPVVPVFKSSCRNLIKQKKWMLRSILEKYGLLSD